MKLRSTLAGAFVVLAGAMTTAAFAQGYVGASVGQSDYKVDCTGLTSCDKKDTGYKLYGGYMFMPYVGVEAGWADLGKVKASGVFEIDSTTVSGTGELKSRGFFLGAIAAAPFDQASVFAKLGFASLKTKLTISALGLSESESKTSTNLYYGFGGGYDFTKNLGARLEWERFRIKYGDEKDNVDLLSLGLLYRF
jgi:OOP family OmpA-OmpF porin